MIIWTKEFTSQKPLIAKWARRGLLLHAIGLWLFMLFAGFSVSAELYGNLLVRAVHQIGYLLLSPFNELSNILFPLSSIVKSDGSVHTEISFIRSTVPSFLNVLLYISIGAFIGYDLQKKAANTKAEEIS